MRSAHLAGAAYADKPSARKTRAWMRMVENMMDEMSEESEDGTGCWSKRDLMAEAFIRAG